MEFDWNAFWNHIIQAVVTIVVAAVPFYFANRALSKKLDANTVETVKGKNAAVAAARTGNANADRLDDVAESVAKAVPATVNVETVNVVVPVTEPVPALDTLPLHGAAPKL